MIYNKHDKCLQNSPCADAMCVGHCPRPRLPASHWSHFSSQGPTLAKTLQKFLQSKTVQILLPALLPARGGSSGGVIAKYLRNVPRLGPGTSISTSARSATLAWLGERGEGGEYVLSKFASSHGSAGPALLAKLCRQETLLFADTGLR